MKKSELRQIIKEEIQRLTEELHIAKNHKDGPAYTLDKIKNLGYKVVPGIINKGDLYFYKFSKRVHKSTTKMDSRDSGGDMMKLVKEELESLKMNEENPGGSWRSVHKQMKLDFDKKSEKKKLEKAYKDFKAIVMNPQEGYAEIEAIGYILGEIEPKSEYGDL